MTRNWLMWALRGLGLLVAGAAAGAAVVAIGREHRRG